MHAELIGVELVLNDFAMVSRKMCEEGEAGYVVVSESGIVEVLEMFGDGVDNLRVEGFCHLFYRCGKRSRQS